MRSAGFILLLLSAAMARDAFAPDYFIKQYNLKLPTIRKEMLDVSLLTHVSDRWEYYYKGSDSKIDSAYRLLTVEGFHPSASGIKYWYNSDSVFEHEVAITLGKGDTNSNELRIYTNNFKSKKVFNYTHGTEACIEFTSWGLRKKEVERRRGEKESSGQVFSIIGKKEYIESIDCYKGVIDSNNIRRYYFTSYDSVVADMLVDKNRPPIMVHLFIRNKDHKVEINYGFGLFSNKDTVVKFNYYTYTPASQVSRIYFFDIKHLYSSKKEYELVNYTEFTYDSLGRKIREITRVKPDSTGTSQDKGK